MDTSNIDFTKNLIIVPGPNFKELDWSITFRQDIRECPLETLYDGYYSNLTYLRIDKKECRSYHNTGIDSLRIALSSDQLITRSEANARKRIPARINCLELY